MAIICDTSVEKSLLSQVDDEIMPLVRALREAGIDTDWSCAGEPGHMVIRPTIQARVNSLELQVVLQQRNIIEKAMYDFGITDYWIALSWGRGSVNTHGGEPVWLIQVAGRHDFLALPVAYALEYIDGQDDIMLDHVPIGKILSRGKHDDDL